MTWLRQEDQFPGKPTCQPCTALWEKFFYSLLSVNLDYTHNNNTNSFQSLCFLSISSLINPRQRAHLDINMNTLTFYGLVFLFSPLRSLSGQRRLQLDQLLNIYLPVNTELSKNCVVSNKLDDGSIFIPLSIHYFSII